MDAAQNSWTWCGEQDHWLSSSPGLYARHQATTGGRGSVRAAFGRALVYCVFGIGVAICVAEFARIQTKGNGILANPATLIPDVL